MSFSLEPILRRWRINQAIPHIPKDCILVDLGCDRPPELLEAVSSKIAYGVGLDEVVKYRKWKNLETFYHRMDKSIKLESDSADVITLLAVLEHLKHPTEILAECYRILKPGGRLLITVPLERSNLFSFLKTHTLLSMLASFKLIRQTMIDQHETYFTPTTLITLLSQVGFSHIHHHRFELGFNGFFRAVKVK